MHGRAETARAFGVRLQTVDKWGQRHPEIRERDGDQWLYDWQAIAALKGRAMPDEAEPVPDPESRNAADQSHEPEAFQDPDNATYWSEPDFTSRRVVVSWPGLKRPIAVPFATDRELILAYVHEGEGRSRRDIARAHGLDFNAFCRYLRARGITKDSPAFADWELDDLSESELAATIEHRRLAKVEAIAERDRVKRLAKYERQRDRFELWAREAADKIVEHVRELPRAPMSLSFSAEAEPLHLIIPETDAHVDALPYDGESAEVYREKLAALRMRLIRRITGSSVRPLSVTLMVGNDWLNADTAGITTTKGTQQVNNLPSTDSAAWATQTAVEAIESYRALGCPVNVVYVEDNHAGVTSRWLYHRIADIYGHSVAAQMTGAEPRDGLRFVEDRDPHGGATGRAWMRYGVTLVCMTHGHEVTDGPKLWSLALGECPELVDGTRRFMCVHGHGHTETWKPMPNGAIIQAPATSPASGYQIRKFGRGRRGWIALGLAPGGCIPHRWGADVDERAA